LANNPPLKEPDLKLLEELGLKGVIAIDSCDKILDSMRMRQLDKLKMVLARLVKEGHFTGEIAEGIRKNDVRMFARAVHVLNNRSLENPN
jgi:hypothetical protein